jgi:hypothetical protein
MAQSQRRALCFQGGCDSIVRHLPEMKRGGVNSLTHRKYQSHNGAQFARRYPMVKVFPTRLKCFPICAE